jgi:hypothetical protein
MMKFQFVAGIIVCEIVGVSELISSFIKQEFASKSFCLFFTGVILLEKFETLYENISNLLISPAFFFWLKIID